ncbi:putative manganese-dependent inorganic diphosphatase [Entomospira nematocerorum]|uniref:inorganic diphosphatase n=1 Tax=Entomospira nematocerorum TaxID=2719987 RepID=A0A968KST1_9SPIO|nr:putative manganese-dependent inorganic diphosphatase [Entomospira nematocera]NIZ46726.1 putative manganese-dependent inorganic diphosphatase [Entomospira nematocera]WDI33478.1 putative manganese-dependent inorganic diphosphatase [Entomospira nematocera]
MEQEHTYKQIYVVGHRNPDADSLIAAHAYAELKQLKGISHAIAIRSGAANSQSEYIFHRFGVPLPQLLSDVIPKVVHHMQENPICITRSESLWTALQTITEQEIDTLPIIDEHGNYLQLLCYESISLYIMKKTSAPLRSIIISNLSLIKSTISAQSLIEFDAPTIKGYTLLVATSYSATFKEEFNQENPENLIVLVGDRFDLQQYMVEKRVAIIIVTNNYLIQPELRALAEKNHVSILISPYDTAATSVMLLYSVPVGQAAIDTPPIAFDMPLHRARNFIDNSTARAVAVIDNQNKVIGLLKELDLGTRPNIALILVDHNELSQAIIGSDKVDILEIIDHHRLGGFKSQLPITFINQTVGSTCTIITNLFKSTHTPLSTTTASLLLCGILSDTVGLKSATTTAIDKETVAYLSSITQLRIEELHEALSNASNQIASKTPAEIIEMDRKEYKEGIWHFFISQVETSSPEIFLQSKELYISVLSQQRESTQALFCALLVTDITTLSSYLIVVGDELFINLIPYPKHTDSIYFLQNVLSRKKQLIPIVTEIMNEL